jgi:phosphinothricin acetyltransferase
MNAIYAHCLRVGTNALELDPPSPSDMADRRANVLAKALTCLVATDEETVLRFACCIDSQAAPPIGSWRTTQTTQSA